MFNFPVLSFWTFGFQFLNFFLLDEMGSHINELEQSINELKMEMGSEGPQPPLPSTTEKPEDSV